MTDDPLGDALGKLAFVTGALREFELPHAELAPPEFENSFAVGAAVRLEAGFVVVSVPLGGQFEIYVTGGAILDVPPDNKLDILTTCNDTNSGWGTPACFLHDAEDTWSILVQHKFPLPIVSDLPPYFRGILDSVASATVELSEKFAEAGLGGRPWTWEVENLKRLLIKSVF